jgi:predicted XRE-type DNA-binding protein
MIAVATNKSQPKAPMTQRRESELLGVTRWHLNRVIRGHVKSRRLSRRLRELRAAYSNLETKNRSTGKKNYEKNKSRSSKETAFNA